MGIFDAARVDSLPAVRERLLRRFVAECIVYGLFGAGLVLAALVRILETVHWLVYRTAHVAARWGGWVEMQEEKPRSLLSWLGLDGE